MKLRKYILGTLAMSAVLSSCDIDRFPYSSVENEQVTSDPDYLKNTVTGIYAYMKDKGHESWINNAHRIAEYTSDNVALSGETTDDLFYMYNYKRVDNGGRNNDFWVRSYKTIAGCNNVITNAPEGKSAVDDHYLGEAYFLRAMMHFYLVNAYGRPYTQGRDNLGVPVKITSDRNDIPGRSTVGQVYDQVIKDLKKAISLMKEEEKTNVKEPFYVTVGGAKGLLSRVYLYMDNNQEALNYADSVITMGYSLLPADQFRKMNTFTPETNSEAIFSIRYKAGIDEGDQNETVGGFYAEIDGMGWGEMYASSSYVDLVNYFPNDARQAFLKKGYDDASTGMEGLWISHQKQKDGFMKPVYKSGVYNSANNTLETEGRTILLQHEVTAAGASRYFFKEGGSDTTVYLDKVMAKRNDYPKFYILKCSMQEEKLHTWSPSIVRLAEMYLNKAEALYKLGRDGEAIIVLNELRQHRDVPAYVAGDVVTGRGKTNLLDVILDERRLELAYEGHRTYDVFRNKRALDRDYPGTHAMNTNSDISISWDAVNAIQLIPRTQINAQGEGLVQNPL